MRCVRIMVTPSGQALARSWNVRLALVTRIDARAPPAGIRPTMEAILGTNRGNRGTRWSSVGDQAS